MPAYYYGGTQINLNSAGVGLYFLSKDLNFPEYKPSTAPVARYDGVKITGWQIPERQIQCDIIVVGTSRSDCIARKDALEAALALRDQQLIIHEDGRIFTANAVAGPARFAPGNILACKIPVKFICANPYAVSASAATPYDSGNLTYTASGGSYVSPTFTVTGGGTAYSWPQLHLVHKTADQGHTTLTSALTQGTSYSSLPVASSPSLTAGQIINLYYSTGSPTFQLWTQKWTVANNVSGGAGSIPVNAQNASYNFPSGTTVYVSTAWNSITIAQTTDNYYLSANSTTAAPLPQTNGDTLDIYCDPDTGMYITTNSLTPYLDPVGAFPPLEPGATQFTVTINADFTPKVDFQVIWTPRYES